VADGSPRVRICAPQAIESRRPREKDGPLFNDPAGEYLPVAFLRDGSLAVVTPIQNASEGRVGFVWWKFASR
jgi:hypothetical protein